MKFAKIALIASLFAAFGAHAGVTASHTANSVTINGTTYTAPTAPFSAVAGVNSSYSTVAFNASTWTVTGGKFTQGTPALTETEAATKALSSWVSTVNSAISSAVSTEVNTINSLVTAANTAIAGYAGTETSTNSATVDAAVDAVYTEVNGTRAAITELKSLNVVVNAAGTSVVIDNSKTHTISQINSAK